MPAGGEGHHPRRRWAIAGFNLTGYLAVLTVAAVSSYWTMFSQFQTYDDEGLHIWGLRQFVDGHALYNSIFTYYGPFHFEFWGGLSAITGITFTTNVGRLVSVGLWLLTTSLLTFVVHRLTGRATLALVTFALSFSVLTAFMNEPMYPGDTALMLVCGSLAAVVYGFRSRRRATVTLVGALLAAILLTKVNVGGFAISAVVFALIVSAPRAGWFRVLRAAVGAAVVFIGPAVMTSTLGEGWTQRYAFLVAVSAIALLLVANTDHLEVSDSASDLWPLVCWLLIGFAMALVVILGISFALGSSPAALYDLVVRTASHQAKVAPDPLPLGDTAYYFPLAAVAAAGLVRLLRSRRLRVPPWFGPTLRLAAGLMIWYAVAGPLKVGPPISNLALALPLTWVAALPSRRDRGGVVSGFIRRFVPALTLLQALIAYPVAGTQLRFAAVLFVVCGAMCVADGWFELELGMNRAHRGHALAPAIPAMALALALVCVLQYIVEPGRTARRAYTAQRPLPFAGANRLRLPAEQVAQLTGVVRTLRTHCHSVISEPAMLSFNAWTELPAPSDMTWTTWWAVLSPAQENQAVRASAATADLCLVRNQAVLDAWLGGRQLPQVPLVAFLRDNFVPIARYGSYVVSVRRQATAAGGRTQTAARFG